MAQERQRGTCHRFVAVESVPSGRTICVQHRWLSNHQFRPLNRNDAFRIDVRRIAPLGLLRSKEAHNPRTCWNMRTGSWTVVASNRHLPNSETYLDTVMGYLLCRVVLPDFSNTIRHCRRLTISPMDVSVGRSRAQLHRHVLHVTPVEALGGQDAQDVSWPGNFSVPGQRL